MKQKGKLLLVGGLIISYFVSCEDNFDIPILSDSEIKQIITALPKNVVYPTNNLYSNEKDELGKMLYWDPILSGNKDVACVTCHHPQLGYADGLKFSQGVGGVGMGEARSGGSLTRRNAPTIINTAFTGIDISGNYNPLDAPMFWDSRASSLEDQAGGPPLSMEEMRGDAISEEHIIDIIIQRLELIPEYKTMFLQAYGDEEISEERIFKAIATYERGIIANNSRFDQYMNGDLTAMTDHEVQGMNAFIQVGCADCHSGPMFSDYKLHSIGVPDNVYPPDEGAGSYDFRTPTLRNLSITGPYMHNGIHATLEEVMQFYEDVGENDEGNDNINSNLNYSQLDPEIRDLQLDDEHFDAIIAFLKTLDDYSFDKTIPQKVPSGLPVGGNIK
ncbi:cytochrome-c peroxidase [Marinifilum breve]|uniref:Cytochrome-c peroxidase n=1 Tax=Marinifilum breve TaxID=2184082 RepID=A0A2V3ZXK5_9BACT|nr:cytochrome c peroxidase [Marinifilum breve]PXX98925.1 cytochrome-c peroxidase [Marinifilum breve]